MLALSPFEWLSYDGYWHVFIARQEQWRIFWEEIQRNAHPPLFYFALKAAIEALGGHLVVYRLVPMCAAVGSAWLVGRIVRRLARNPWLPAISAFAFGASLSATTIGLDVRSYSLAILFMLAACRALLDLVGQGFAAPDFRARAAFALTASLALLTHYAAAIFLFGCLAAALLPAAVDPAYRRRLLAAKRPQWAANLLTFGVPGALLATAYIVHLSSWRQLYHVPAFLFDPSREGAVAFVWRNTGALLELFVPQIVHRPFASTLVLPGPPRLSGVAVGLLAAAALVALVGLGLRPAGRKRDALAGPVERRVPPLMVLTMTGLLIALALLGRHPYGGDLRHQFVLFPFALIVAALVADEVAVLAARRFGRRLGTIAIGLFALGTGVNTASWVAQFEVIGTSTRDEQIARFRELFPAVEAIYVDEFNLVNLFIHHDQQRWQFVREIPGVEQVDLWRVGGRGAAGFELCRDRAQWELDLSAKPTYRRLRRCLDAAKAERVTVFRLQQHGTSPRWRVARTEELAARLAASTGMVLEALEVSERGDVYAAFGRRPGPR